MGKFAILKNLFLIILLVGVVWMISYYAEPVKNMALGMMNMQDNKVLGASSQRANEITGKVGSDITAQAENVKDQVFNVNLGSVFEIFSRAQKIPQDIQAAGEYIHKQADTLLNNKKE